MATSGDPQLSSVSPLSVAVNTALSGDPQLSSVSPLSIIVDTGTGVAPGDPPGITTPLAPPDTGIIVSDTFLGSVDVNDIPESLILSNRPVLAVLSVSTEDVQLVSDVDYRLVRDVNTEMAGSVFSVDRIILSNSGIDKINPGDSITISYIYDKLIGDIHSIFAGARSDFLSSVGAMNASIMVRRATRVETLLSISVTSVRPDVDRSIVNDNATRMALLRFLSDSVFIQKLNLSVTHADIVKAIQIVDPSVLVSSDDIKIFTKAKNTGGLIQNVDPDGIQYGPNSYPLLSAIRIT